MIFPIFQRKGGKTGGNKWNKHTRQKKEQRKAGGFQAVIPLPEDSRKMPPYTEKLFLYNPMGGGIRKTALFTINL
jgi:hypothetical protein